jgi:hypothetical protein
VLLSIQSYAFSHCCFAGVIPKAGYMFKLFTYDKFILKISGVLWNNYLNAQIFEKSKILT